VGVTGDVGAVGDVGDAGDAGDAGVAGAGVLGLFVPLGAGLAPGDVEDGTCPGFPTGVDDGVITSGVVVVCDPGWPEGSMLPVAEQARCAAHSAASMTADRPRAGDASMDHSWWTKPGQSHAKGAGARPGRIERVGNRRRGVRGPTGARLSAPLAQWDWSETELFSPEN
jgi:hypothetical protein